MPAHKSPLRGFKAICVLLYFGAVMATLAGVTLIWRGTFLDRLWVLNPHAYKQLSPIGAIAGVSFLLLGATLAVAGVGWSRRRFWGWPLAVVLIATQVLGSLVNAARGDFVKGSAGFILSGALLYFLLRAKVRAAFYKAPF